MPYIPPVPATIRTLSDQDLADSLREYNVNVGPIVGMCCFRVFMAWSW